MRFFKDKQERLLGVARSPQWEGVRKAFLSKNPLCAVCGKESTFFKPLEIHHCIPFHLDASSELSENNLITLCREHHLLFGHFMNWKSFNADVRLDTSEWRFKILNRPKRS